MLVRGGLPSHAGEPDAAQAEVLAAGQRAAEADQVGMWVPDACGAASTGEIAIGTVRYDADGNNNNNNLNDEWVEITKSRPSAVDLTGWKVKDESASHRYSFPRGFTLAAGATVRLHTGCGKNTATALRWCNTGSAIWNNSGVTVFVLDPAGNIVALESY